MIEIVEHPIDAQALLAAVQQDRAGAAVLFLGTTRQFTDGRETVRLDYECYQEMALKKLSELREQAMEKWPLEACGIVHRVGTVPVGEASVAIAVATPHRTEAFDAAKWIIDTLKQVVPIWKRENFSDGSKEWVHPD